MHRVHGLARKRREGVLVADVDVLNVELDSVEPVVATERGEAPHRAAARRAHREHAMNRRLAEAGVEHERHEFDALRARRLDDAPIHAATDHAKTVEREHLRGHDGDLVRVEEETLHAGLTTRVPQRLEFLCRGTLGQACEQHDRDGDSAVHATRCDWLVVFAMGGSRARARRL